MVLQNSKRVVEFQNRSCAVGHCISSSYSAGQGEALSLIYSKAYILGFCHTVTAGDVTNSSSVAYCEIFHGYYCDRQCLHCSGLVCIMILGRLLSFC